MTQDLLESVLNRLPIPVLTRLLPFTRSLIRKSYLDNYWRDYLHCDQERYHSSLVEAAKINSWFLFDRLWRLGTSYLKIPHPVTKERLPLIQERKILFKAFNEASWQGYEEVASLIHQIDSKWIDEMFEDVTCLWPSHLNLIFLYQRLIRTARNNDLELYHEILTNYQLEYYQSKGDEVSSFIIENWIKTTLTESSSVDFVLSVLATYSDLRLNYVDCLEIMLRKGKYETVLSLVKEKQLDRQLNWNYLIQSTRPDAVELIKNHLPEATVDKIIMAGYGRLQNGSILLEYLKNNPNDYNTIVCSNAALPPDQYIELIKRIPLSFDITDGMFESFGYTAWEDGGDDYLVLIARRLRNE